MYCREDLGNVRAQYLDIPWKGTEPTRQSPDKTPTSTADLAVPANDSLSGRIASDRNFVRLDF
jgi:hypothetical protein